MLLPAGIAGARDDGGADAGCGAHRAAGLGGGPGGGVRPALGGRTARPPGGNGRGVHLLQSRNDPSQLLALSIWDREVDLLAAREQPQYQDTMAGLAETYAEPQSVGEWDVVEL